MDNNMTNINNTNAPDANSTIDDVEAPTNLNTNEDDNQADLISTTANTADADEHDIKNTTRVTNAVVNKRLADVDATMQRMESFMKEQAVTISDLQVQLASVPVDTTIDTTPPTSTILPLTAIRIKPETIRAATPAPTTLDVGSDKACFNWSRQKPVDLHDITRQE